MSECTESIDDVKRVKHILTNDELLDGQGLTLPPSADKQTGVRVFLFPTHPLELLQFVSMLVFSLRCDREVGAPPGSNAG